MELCLRLRRFRLEKLLKANEYTSGEVTLLCFFFASLLKVVDSERKVFAQPGANYSV